MTGQADFNDLLRNATGLLRGMWTHRWEGLAAAWGVGLLALVALFFVPHRYEATARLYVNTDSILKPLMRDITVQPNDEQRITMLSRVVISRPNIETLVQKSGLEAQARTPAERERIVDGLMKSLEFDNLIPMISAGLHNISLTKYLIQQATQSHAERGAALREFMPEGRDDDWELLVAGQRVQVIRSDEEQGGVLEFGTEIIAAHDGSLVALLGASPGASTSVAIALDILDKCLRQ